MPFLLDPWLTAPAAGLLLAAGLLAYALRGRRVDDHPICRRCGFDLFGKPLGSTVCSECGADLGRRRAVRVGRRERRRGLLMAGAAVLVVSGGWLGTVGWVVARRVDVNRHKPEWLLAREAERGSPAARDAALAELVRRTADGTLSRPRLDQLVDKALAVQADVDAPWSSGWGVLVEAAEAAGKLPPEKWSQYLANAIPVRLVVRSRVRHGDPIPVEFWVDPGRRGRVALGAWIDLSPELTIGSRTLAEAHLGTGGFPASPRAVPTREG